jgi:hypothetical protein
MKNFSGLAAIYSSAVSLSLGIVSIKFSQSVLDFLSK